MSGKPYTMREMKAIVDYLIEQRAFADVKGRKMWMEYANSKLTTRTWQSLKETFLKRILPDIANPYYKLSVEQIASFQNGTDLEAKINNKLEIQTIQDDSSSDKNDPQPSNSNNIKGENDTGEDTICSKTNQNRSSTETVVIGPCYNTAEEIQKDLESPPKENGKENPSPIPCSTKSIRDYITYTEPLTPMLQEVLHDFASEDEGEEPQMQIVEYPEPSKKKETSSVIEIEDSEKTDRNENDENADNNTDKDKSNNVDSTTNNINENVVLESDVNNCVDKSDVQCIDDSEEIAEPITDKNDFVPDIAINNVSKNNEEKDIHTTKSQNNSNSITDTLPNNQEAYKELLTTSERPSDKQDFKDISSNESINNSRKRSKSKEINCLTPEKRTCADKTRERNSSDRDTTAHHNQNALKLNSKNGKTEVKGQANTDNETNIDHNTVNVNNTLNVIDEKLKSCRNSSKTGESVCISDDSLPDRQHPRDVSIKTDKDENSLTSEDRESSKTDIVATRRTSNKKSTKQNEKPVCNKEVMNEVVILKSHSESTSDRVVVSPKKNKASLRAAHKMPRDRALANVFGFSSGIKSNRTKHKNVRRVSSHHRKIKTSTSEETTSDSESEFISPPRGRKNKQSRKYLKPKSARIASLEEDGGLFVVYKKKIYPLVKDGKLVKNYLVFTPDNDSEVDESYWKLKYVEEKKKTDELTKLLKDNKESTSVPRAPEEIPVPPPPKECEKPAPTTEPPKEIVEKSVEQCCKEPVKKDIPAEPKTVKIQFMKDNETVQVEGHWSHIQPVLEQVVQILHKEPEPTPREKPLPEKKRLEREATPQIPDNNEYQTPAKKQKVSRDSTPISTIQLDEDVNEKLDKIEEEIYKKIQERDLAESSHEDTANTNVTKRRVGRPRLSSLATNKADSVSEPARREPSVRPTDEESNDSSIVTRRQARTPRKTNEKETTEKVTNDGKRTTRKSSRSAAVEDDDSSIKYKFPSPPPGYATNKNKSTRNVTTKATKRRYPIKIARIFSSPDNMSINSIESSQGYQDSDGSNLSNCHRKKRKLSLTVLNRGRARSRRAPKRKTQPHIQEDLSSDSNITFVTAPLKSASHQSSSLNTEVYRSESYQLLFPQSQNSIQLLEKIEEGSPTIDNLNKNSDAASDKFAEKSSLSVNENNSRSPAIISYEENSSNVTLPPSPVLSIVEKLTLSKNTLDNTDDIDMLDDNHEGAKQTMLNDYMLLDADMSVPLMEQECDLQSNHLNETECHFNFNVPETSQKMSDSFLNKVGAVNIAEPTLSESIHQKLKNLLLESTKKIAKQMQEKNDNDKIDKMEICVPENQKSKARKRCSTPRKRQSKQLSKRRNVEQHIEEEHVESCGNENPRPLPMLIVTDTIEVNDKIAATNVSGKRRSERIRKKKDVIKVKILKPRMKTKEYSSDNTTQQQAKTSLQADSGINDMESGVFFRGIDDSVDLIHNHSDTCVQTRECLDDSVEIIDENAMSVISLNSTSGPNKKIKSASLPVTTEDKLSDICCELAQDAANLCTVTEIPQCTSKEKNFKSLTTNISPVNSLLTDDLSDEISDQNNACQNRVTKWYLLSEDETSNTNNIDVVVNVPNSNAGYGANLQEIFPITCAVPDLSTITEENTNKFLMDGNTKSQFDSQSLPSV